MPPTVATDGSSVEDSREIVVIDRSDPADRYRFVCSGDRQHIDWDRTNNHVWCRGCLRQSEQGEDVDPEKWSVFDKKTGEVIPWSAVRLVE